MCEQSIRTFAHHGQHLRTDGAHHDGRVRRVDRAWVEEGLKPGEAIVLTDELERLAGSKSVEDRAQ